MNIALIFKIILLIFSALIVIHSLVEVSNKKTKFQIYPDSIKKNFFKQIKLMAILNYFSVFLILVACYFITSNFYYILIVISSFVSLTSTEFIYEDFNMFDDTDENDKK